MLSSTSSSSAPQRAGARAALTGFAAMFVAACVLMAVASEWLLRTQVQPQDTQAAHVLLLSTDARTDVSFGDSHVARGFDARDGFVNLAYPSESIDDIAAKIELYFEARDPGRVILQADPHMFAPYRLRAAPKRYAPPPNVLLTSTRHRPRMLAYWEAFLRDGGQLKSKVRITEAGALLSGGNLAEVAPRRRVLEARSRRNWHRIDHPVRVKPAQKRYSRMLDDLKARGADVCVVRLTVSSYYTDVVSSVGHQEMMTFFAGEASRTGARMVDMRNDVSDLSLFRDVDHLNAEGAMSFASTILDRCFGVTEG
mgnify:FL=1